MAFIVLLATGTISFKTCESNNNPVSENINNSIDDINNSSEKTNSDIVDTNDNKDENVKENNNQVSENTNVDNTSTDLLDGNIIVTQNGKVISNKIPSDLVGKYVNKNSDKSYIQLTNGNVEVSEPIGSGNVRVFKNDQVKLYINYLNSDVNSKQYITVEFYIEDNGYNQKVTYTYIGLKSSHDNAYHFKTPDPTSVGGEGKNDYPYSK